MIYLPFIRLTAGCIIFTSILSHHCNICFFIASLMSDVEAQEHYDTFFEDVFLELEEKVCTENKLYLFYLFPAR